MPIKGPVITVIDFNILTLIKIKQKPLIEEISVVFKKEFTHKQIWMIVKKLEKNKFLSIMKNGKHQLTVKGKGELAKINRRADLIDALIGDEEEPPIAA